jgi:hypothetical protein
VRHKWLTSVILATREAEIRKIWFKASPSNNNRRQTLFQKHQDKKGLVAQVVEHEVQTPVSHTPSLPTIPKKRKK